MNTSIYQNIATRTAGDIYIGVVGPVRTGKSTFIKRFMETQVIPNIDNVYRKERARDELPQSGSGKTIMTSEPKFVPEEAVEISPDGTAKLRVRMIDSVGYMVAGAVGATEDGAPRMVTTPWYDHEIPMTEAAELGTKKVMEDHCSIGLVVTTDGTITDIPREDYLTAEDRAIGDMKATGKPFVVVVNSREPRGNAARELCSRIQETYQEGPLRRLPDHERPGDWGAPAGPAVRLPHAGAAGVSAPVDGRPGIRSSGEGGALRRPGQPGRGDFGDVPGGDGAGDPHGGGACGRLPPAGDRPGQRHGGL